MKRLCEECEREINTEAHTASDCASNLRGDIAVLESELAQVRAERDACVNENHALHETNDKLQRELTAWREAMADDELVSQVVMAAPLGTATGSVVLRFRTAVLAQVEKERVL